MKEVPPSQGLSLPKYLLQMQSVRVKECVSAKAGVGRNEAGCGTFPTGDAHALVRHFRIVFATVIGGIALTVDLPFRVQVVDDKHHDIQNLRIGEGLLVVVEIAQIFDAAFFHHIKKSELTARQFRFDQIRLSEKGEVDVGIGARQNEQLFSVKDR